MAMPPDLMRLYQTMMKYQDYGALDSEGHQIISVVEYAAAAGRNFPLRGSNPFQLYEKPGWEGPSKELVECAEKYYLSLRRRGGTINQTG